jgi:hypothetical protein
MEPFIQASGLMATEMDMDHKCGLTVQDMKEDGRTIRPMDKAN